MKLADRFHQNRSSPVDSRTKLAYNKCKHRLTFNAAMKIPAAGRNESVMTLDQVKPGHSGVIAVVGGEGALRRRLLDMGLTPNTKVMVRKVAPMGDPIELFLRSYVLTLRKDDAAKIEIKDGTLA